MALNADENWFRNNKAVLERQTGQRWIVDPDGILAYERAMKARQEAIHLEEVRREEAKWR
jgi:hypothetical protein